MKITFLLTWGDAMGGTERAVLRQANWLAARHDVEVLSVFRTRDTPAFAVDPRVRMTYLVDTRESLHRPAGRELSDEVCRVLSATPSELVRPEWEQAFTRLADLELERVLRECTSDIVVSTTPALMAVMTELVPRRVVTVHQEHRVAELRGSSGNPLKLFSARLDAVVLLSEPTRNWFASLFGAAAPRLAIIPNSIDDGYRPRSSRTNPTIVMAGQLTGEKQFGHAITAFAQLAADHPDWCLRIFGDGARRELENQIVGLGLGEQVQLMGSTTTIDNEWAKAAIAMVTSRVESFGLTIVEAMAAAVPVVSYDCPNGPREIIESEKTGLLVAPNNTDALAAALRRLIEDEELRHGMGERAATAVERFAPDVVMARWEELYAELLTGRENPNWAERRTFALALHQAQSTDAGVVTEESAEEFAAPDVAAWTAATQELHPDLVWSRGQLTRIRDDMAPYETARANLDLTVAALEAAEIDYFLVRQDTPTYRVAVREERREAALAAIARTTHDRPAYVEGFDVRHRTLGNWQAALSDTVEQLRTAASVRIFEPVITTSHTMRIGAIYGCELEFWTPSEDGTELAGLAPTLAKQPAGRVLADARAHHDRRPDVPDGRAVHPPARQRPHVRGRRRVHLGGRRRPGVAGAQAGRARRRLHRRRGRPGPGAFPEPRRAALLAALHRPLRAVDRQDLDRHGPAGTRLARRRPPPDQDRRPPRDLRRAKHTCRRSTRTPSRPSCTTSRACPSSSSTSTTTCSSVGCSARTRSSTPAACRARSPAGPRSRCRRPATTRRSRWPPATTGRCSSRRTGAPSCTASCTPRTRTGAAPSPPSRRSSRTRCGRPRATAPAPRRTSPCSRRWRTTTG
nr:hypothetical protein GCM10020092_054750 [Actinoplanes digitatis]